MKITKFGHCCLLIEENGTTILTDPGTFTTEQDNVKGIDIILITHEHQDHFHIDSVKRVLVNNPQAKIITNSAVGKLLSDQGIQAEIVEHLGSKQEKGVLFEGFGKDHAVIYEDFGKVINTGYFIGSRLFYPGDSFYNPVKEHNRGIEILALPVSAPWMKASEAIDYALAVSPKIAFPVHDALYKNTSMSSFLPSAVLPKKNINFSILEIGIPKEL